MSIPARTVSPRHIMKPSGACVAATLLTLLVACGGGGGGGNTPPPAGNPTGQVSNPLDVPLEDGALSVSGINADAAGQPVGLNSPFATLALQLSDGSFHPDDDTVGRFWLQGASVDAAAIQRINGAPAAALNFADGPNTVAAEAHDAEGRRLFLQRTVWSGSRTLDVTLVDAQGQPWLGSTTLNISPADDTTVVTGLNVANGQGTPTRLPSQRAVLIQARAGAALGVACSVAGAPGGTTLTMLEPGTATTPNLNFAAGLAGWRTSSGAAQIVTTAGDADLHLSTQGQAAPQMARHSFRTPAGVQAVTVRYRFVTTEDLTAIDAALHADFYRVQLRTRAGQSTDDTQTTVSLGAAAFDTGGSTAWRSLRIATDPAGDEVDVDAIVGNVLDARADSQLVIDEITSDTAALQAALAWDATAGGLTLRVTTQGPDAAQGLGAAPARRIQLVAASGPQAHRQVGPVLSSVTVPAGTPTGSTLSFTLNGGALDTWPAGSTHVLALDDDGTVLASVRDAQLVAGPHAQLDDDGLGAGLREALLAGARRAGVAQLSVAMTGLRPAQLARAMFLNLTRSTATVAANVASQNALYGTEGRAVIQVFSQQTQGMERGAIVAARATIEAAMTQAIAQQGPSRVLRHAVDPAVTRLAEVRKASLPNDAASTRFRASLSAQGATVSDEGTRWLVTLPVTTTAP